MTPERWHDIERVVREALAVSPGTRGAVVDRECGDNVAMRREVESLLAASSAAGDFLESPPIVLSRNRDDASDDALPAHIGNYRVVRRLGVGGMGVVYLAEQNNPQRQVAVKLIRAGAAATNGRLRFEREAQVLARLKHPGIAQIYEAGYAQVDGEHRAFIAMEFVEGESLTTHVDRVARSIRERLELFVAICDAVQHAHQKGVIHRDLKPGNILVQSGADSSSAATPKVLDFGIARIIDDDSAAVTISEPQHLIGTLHYMSPEQLDGDRDDVDTRADVYALGVVGYEMLCGELPYDIRGKSSPDVIRRIIDALPTRLSRVDAKLAGDLETIFARALEKQPQRRYASASALADDVRRHLNHQPITARPPGAMYLFRKFAQRNRGVVVGVLTAMVGLIGGTAFATWKAIEAHDERDRAVKAEKLAATRLEEAIDARREAEFDAATTSAVRDFLRETLTSADPEAGDQSNATIRQALSRAAEKLRNELSDQPHVETEVRYTIGKTYVALGAYDEATAHLEKALDIAERVFLRKSGQVADILQALGVLRRETGEYADSESLLSECLQVRQSFLNEPHSKIASAMSELAATFVRMGRLNEAEALHQRALKMRRALFGDQSLEVAESLSRIAIAQRYLKRLNDAEANYRESLAIRRAELREDHPHIAVTLHNLGRVLTDQGRLDEANEAIREALDLIRRPFPGAHPRTANMLSSLANVMTRLDHLDEADAILEETIGMQQALFPDGHVGTIKTMVQMARLDIRRNNFDSARSTLEEAGRLASELGSLNDRWGVVNVTVPVLLRQKQPAHAEELVRDFLIDFLEQNGEEHETVAHAYMTLGEIQLSTGELSSAREHVEHSLAIRRRVHDDKHPLTTLAVENLAYVCRQLGDLERARELLVEAVPRRREQSGASNLQTLNTMFDLACVYFDLNNPDDAVPIFRECLNSYREISKARAAERVIECAMFLKKIAVGRSEPGLYDRDINIAISHARNQLGPDHSYFVKVVNEINEVNVESDH